MEISCGETIKPENPNITSMLKNKVQSWQKSAVRAEPNKYA